VIPFFEIPAGRIGPFEVHVYALLVAAGVISGYFWLRRRVQRLGCEVAYVAGMAFWTVIIGFAGSLAFKIFYLPNVLRLNAWNLIRMGAGIASFGGLFAGLIGAYVYLRISGLGWREVQQYIDALAFVFPRAWLLGRIGCALVHDHAGVRTQSWLGVQYPGGPRYDLGLLEVLFILAYLGLLAILDRGRRRTGFYLALFLTSYGAFRLLLDNLHDNAVRYLNWTVDQYASTIAILAGSLIFVLAFQKVSASSLDRKGAA
jgi:phosphatidylglycerol:prolipoprotein diacylglycerol transferase